MAAFIDVNVIGARGLPAEWHESADCYAVLEYKGHKHKTKADKNSGSNPNWNKRFKIPLGHPPGIIDVKVFDDDPVKDDFKGQTTIDVNSIIGNGNYARAFYTLHGKQGRGHYGEIELEFTVSYSEGYTPESAARLEALEKQEDKHETHQLIAGAAALAAAGVAAYAGHQAATGHGNKTTNTVIAGLAGAAAVAATGYGVSEHLKETKVEKQQESLGAEKHGWFD